MTKVVKSNFLFKFERNFETRNANFMFLQFYEFYSTFTRFNWNFAKGLRF